MREIWFASGGGIARCGPFKSAVEAWKAMRLARSKQVNGLSLYPADVCVWPEEINEEINDC